MIKVVIPTDNSLRVKIIAVTGCEPFDCSNKDESLLSLFKRAIVTLPDGTQVLQVCYASEPLQ